MSVLGVLQNWCSQKFSKTHSIFFNWITGLYPGTALKKTHEIFKTTFFIEHLRWLRLLRSVKKVLEILATISRSVFTCSKSAMETREQSNVDADRSGVSIVHFEQVMPVRFVTNRKKGFIIFSWHKEARKMRRTYSSTTE